MASTQQPLWRQALERLLAVVNPDRLTEVDRLQWQAWSGAALERVPVVMTWLKDASWPYFTLQEAFDDPEKMFWNELGECYLSCLVGDDRPLTIRANYGPGIVASLFGAPTRLTEGDRPWTDALSPAALARCLEQGVPDVHTDLGGRVLSTEALFRDWLQAYPPLDQCIHVYCCDTQGPFDIAHLIWGTSIYLALADEPERVHKLLHLITEAIIALTHAQKQVIGEPVDGGYHRYYTMLGGARIVDDVSVNLSPAMYRQFCLPYNTRVFAPFAGGYMHYCGDKIAHNPDRLGTPGLRAVELGFDNPGRNPDFTFSALYHQAQRAGVTLLWVGDDLPPDAPLLSKGLLYLDNSQPPDIVAARRRLQQIREFWQHRLVSA